MRLKQLPRDFSVKESYRFTPTERGAHRVYLLRKRKKSTFEALGEIRKRFGLPPGSISYCGLKDKQGVTSQLIAVRGRDVRLQTEHLRLKYLGRSQYPLSARNTTSNRFAVTVRQLRVGDLNHLPQALTEIEESGIVNYFDSQRFGSLKHGQGFIAKDLIHGHFEHALWNHLAKPSSLDRSVDGKIKTFWKEHWGQWRASCPHSGKAEYARIVHFLRKHPQDYLGAFLQIESDYRALLLFAYQSYLWNECARKFLQQHISRSQLFPIPYQAGTLLFQRRCPRTFSQKPFPSWHRTLL